MATPTIVRFLLRAAALLPLFTATHAAPPEKTSALINFANDYANILTQPQLQALEQQLVDISRGGRYQIAVATYRNLPEGTTAEETTELADRLMVGTSLGDRGIVILAFPDLHRVRIEVGYGLEGLVPDAVAHRAAEVAAARFKEGEYAGGLKEAVEYLGTRAGEATRTAPPKKSRWEWLPDFMLAFGDAGRGFAFFATHRHEIPKQLAIWWKAQDSESRSVIGALLAAGALYVLVLLRVAVGSILCMLLPPASVRNSAMRWIFFRFTDASFEKSWKAGGAGGAPPRSGHYLFDALYYGVPALLVVGIAMGGFITFVGHVGGFGGAGAQAIW